MNLKPKLTYQQQIEHLIAKGIKFEHFKKDDALRYLEDNNNFFKLSSYRKNFAKNDKTGKYINLDFAQLVDLAVIDTRIRMIIIEMALNIEHFAKVKLLKRVTDDKNENGYCIVLDYLDNLSADESEHLETEIKRNQNSIYVKDVYEKYKSELPIWAFVEILSFGSFIHFYKYCATRFNDKEMMDDVYLFLTVKKIRNASAHNNCLINDLSIKSHKYKINYKLKDSLSKIGIRYDQRKRKMACERTAQIITCLYTHKKIASSKGIHRHISARLDELRNRLFRDFDYKQNLNILTTFELLIKIIDNWFHVE